MADTSKVAADTGHGAETGPRSMALDGYRALAISIVMLNHARFTNGYPDWLLPVSGYLKGGITAFMVLSGYLVTTSLLREEARSGVMGGWAFLRRLAVRIYVPLIAYLAIVCVWFSNRPDFDWWRTLRVLWLDPHTGASGFWSMHLYSTAAQLQFFLWWPLVLRLIPRGHRLLPVTVLMLLAVMWRNWGRELTVPPGGNLLRTDFVYGSLLVGSWWAILAQKGRLEWMLRLKGLRLLPLVVLALFVVVFTRSPSATLGLFSPELREWVAPWRTVPWITYPIRLLSALGAMMAFGCLSYLLHRGRPVRVAQLFASPVIAWLGRISFSVYLWQNVFCFGITGTIADRFGLNFLATIACGYLAYRLFEVPSLRWRSQLKRMPANSGSVQPDA